MLAFLNPIGPWSKLAYDREQQRLKVLLVMNNRTDQDAKKDLHIDPTMNIPIHQIPFRPLHKRISVLNRPTQS